MIKPSPLRVDVIGSLCPLPILMAIRAMRKLEPGERLELIGDDPGIAEDIPIWCDKNGHVLVDLVDDLGTVTCLIEKGQKRDGPEDG